MLKILPWIKRKPNRPQVTEVHTPSLRFLGEQEGPVERQVKAAWAPILAASPNVNRAFLLRALYADKTQHVVLALCAVGQPDVDLVRALRVPYAAIFSSDCPLDMAFVNAAQESEVEKVCSPFYVSV